MGAPTADELRAIAAPFLVTPQTVAARLAGPVVEYLDAQRSHDRTVVEDFRRRVIRAMGGLRVTTDEAEYTDLVELDAVLEAIGRTPAVSP